MHQRTWKEIEAAYESLEKKKARIDWMAYTIYLICGLFLLFLDDLIINVIP